MAEQRPAETKFATCRVCGSAETVETGTQKCPGCGAPYTEPLSSNPRLEMRQRMLADEERSDEDFERLARLISLEAHEDRLKLWEDVERLTAELDKMRQLDESHWLCRRELAQNRDMWQQRHDRLRANQAEAVRILSAIEFDGQAYAAIQRACKLLAGAAEVNAALNIGQETGHAKRTADETSVVRAADWIPGPEDDPVAFCGACGAQLEAVMPGKFQHVGPCPAVNRDGAL